MKLLCCGDLHLRATAPRYRIDNYYETQMGKLKWIFELAREESCEAILQPGDFFDSPNIPNHVLSDVLELLYKYDHNTVYTVFGQHDLRYRNMENSALSVVEIAGGVVTENTILVGGRIAIYGSSWEQPIPEVLNKDAVNILLMHRMVVHEKPLWPGQTDYTKAGSFMKKYSDFDLVVSGDNHQSFIWAEYDKETDEWGRWLINCGSMMRMTTAQQEHKPCVWVYDTETKEAIRHFIPIEKDVFSPEAVEIKERNKELEAFITTLKQDRSTMLSFDDNVAELVKAEQFSIALKKLVNGFMEGYYGSR